MMTFTIAGSAHGFIHHHHTQTDDEDCAFCSFHNNTALSNVPIVIFDLTPVFLLVFTIPVLKAVHEPVAFSIHSGRAPPVVLS